MIVIKATQEQYEALNGFSYKNNILLFAKDRDNNWIVGLEVLHNGNFLEIREQLQSLEQIEYVPPVIEE